jgi:hypothetical protein
MKWEIFTEFKSKKDTDIVVCNLLENVPHPGVNQYVECPICSTPELTPGYSDKRRRKLYTDGYIGYCFRCHRTFLNPRPDPGDMVSVREPNLGTKVVNYNVPELDGTEFNSFSDLNESGLHYLRSRNPIFTKDFCKSVNIKSVPNGVVIPFYLDGNLVYYVVRFIHTSFTHRYMMPPTHNKPLYIPNLVSKKKFILCEGVFDAFACLLLYPDYTPCAVLGSKITENQLHYLSQRFNPTNILIYMDDSGRSNKNLEFIRRNWRGMYDIDIVESDGTDPEEYLNSLLK